MPTVVHSERAFRILDVRAGGAVVWMVFVEEDDDGGGGDELDPGVRGRRSSSVLAAASTVRL